MERVNLDLEITSFDARDPISYIYVNIALFANNGSQIAVLESQMKEQIYFPNSIL